MRERAKESSSCAPAPVAPKPHENAIDVEAPAVLAAALLKGLVLLAVTVLTLLVDFNAI